MDNIWILIITSLASGIIATIITLIVQGSNEKKKTKRDVFATLMAHRYLIHDKDNVETLNKIDAVFYKEKQVRDKWVDFMNACDKASKDPSVNIYDKYLKLLEVMADAVGYKDISWDEIKQAYSPKGLMDKITEESVLRRAQIQQMTHDYTQDRVNPMTAQEMGMQFVLKALDSPNGMDTIAKLIEIGEKQNKKK